MYLCRRIWEAGGDDHATSDDNAAPAPRDRCYTRWDHPGHESYVTFSIRHLGSGKRSWSIWVHGGGCRKISLVCRMVHTILAARVRERRVGVDNLAGWLCYGSARTKYWREMPCNEKWREPLSPTPSKQKSIGGHRHESQFESDPPKSIQ
jgi:hypothetical protein